MSFILISQDQSTIIGPYTSTELSVIKEICPSFKIFQLDVFATFYRDSWIQHFATNWYDYFMHFLSINEKWAGTFYVDEISQEVFNEWFMFKQRGCQLFFHKHIDCTEPKAARLFWELSRFSPLVILMGDDFHIDHNGEVIYGIQSRRLSLLKNLEKNLN